MEFYANVKNEIFLKWMKLEILIIKNNSDLKANAIFSVICGA